MHRDANYFFKRYLSSISILLLVLGAGCSTPVVEEPAPETYQPNWESLARHNEQAEWLADAKLGIYFHWGVYSVPAFGSEWYPRNMHFKSDPAYKHHVETYGDPSEFGYHDFVPMFKAENFDPEEWADLFQRTGARFAGPVAEHHDGFSMWDSDQTPWSAGKMGPKRDITGELAKSLRARNMKLITTFHHGRNLQRYRDRVEEQMAIEREHSRFSASHYPFYEGYPPTSDDPLLSQLYGNIPEGIWLEQMWLGKLKEVIDKYQPDIIWFDSWLDEIPAEKQMEFCAYYLNRAEEWGKDVVIVRKQDDLPLDVSIVDMEKSRMPGMNPHLWMTDDTISKGSWCYTSSLTIKSAQDVLHSFIDTVSKNGVLLLNVSPMANGTIPDDQVAVLEEIGHWMDKYGEAIYETRPWITYGEGPTREPEGGFSDHQKFLKVVYSSEDIRYTSKGDSVFAFMMGWPGPNKPITMRSFEQVADDITSISLLGSTETVQWEKTDQGLVVYSPKAKIDEIATVFKIEM